jgi:hypothetical protein
VFHLGAAGGPTKAVRGNSQGGASEAARRSAWMPGCRVACNRPMEQQQDADLDAVVQLRRPQTSPSTFQTSFSLQTMPGIDFQAVRDRVPMSRVLELIHYEPFSRLGEQLRGPCPIHKSESPRSRSFSVDLCGNRFQCFKPESVTCLPHAGFREVGVLWKLG